VPTSATTSVTTVATTGPDTSGASLDGYVVEPGDTDWDVTRAAWGLTTDQQPDALVWAASERDVVATVRAARASGRRVALQGTGPDARTPGALRRTVVLRTGGLRTVEIDAERRVARVGAGALWGDVADAAGEIGLTALAGSARDAGVVGATSGGGLSWLARSHGLAADHVTAVEIVTLDGRRHRVDEDHDTDLFRALRGGGAGPGVVTALELRLFPITQVQAGALCWPVEHAAAVLHTWRELTAVLPDEVTSVGRLLRFPAVPAIAEPVRGRGMVAIELVSGLDRAPTAALVAPLRALHPELDTVATTPVTALGHLHRDPQRRRPVTGDGLLLTELSAATLDAYLAVAGPGSGLTLLSTELRHLGGALTPGGAGAGSGFDAAFLLYSATPTADAGAVAAAGADLARIAAAVAPWTARSTPPMPRATTTA
jgi:FAD/FMN-containing dehydrogenase